MSSKKIQIKNYDNILGEGVTKQNISLPIIDNNTIKNLDYVKKKSNTINQEISNINNTSIIGGMLKNINIVSLGTQIIITTILFYIIYKKNKNVYEHIEKIKTEIYLYIKEIIEKQHEKYDIDIEKINNIVTNLNKQLQTYDHKILLNNVENLENSIKNIDLIYNDRISKLEDITEHINKRVNGNKNYNMVEFQNNDNLTNKYEDLTNKYEDLINKYEDLTKKYDVILTQNINISKKYNELLSEREYSKEIENNISNNNTKKYKNNPNNTDESLTENIKNNNIINISRINDIETEEKTNPELQNNEKNNDIDILINKISSDNKIFDV